MLLMSSQLGEAERNQHMENSRSRSVLRPSPQCDGRDAHTHVSMSFLVAGVASSITRVDSEAGRPWKKGLMAGPSKYVTLRWWFLAENTEAENWVFTTGRR